MSDRAALRRKIPQRFTGPASDARFCRSRNRAEVVKTVAELNGVANVKPAPTTRWTRCSAVGVRWAVNGAMRGGRLGLRRSFGAISPLKRPYRL
jgi:hypothetical protein